jgi:hypothetical protein
MSESRAGAIAIRLRDVAQLFNSLDPSSFHEKDLDPGAREFIVARFRDEPSDAKLVLTLHLDQPPTGGPEECRRDVEDAVRNDFAYQADLRRRDLSELFTHGRISLVIGLLFLVTCLGTAHVLESAPGGAILNIARESLVIACWVAMWRPIEIFLYEWWPLAGRIRLLRRLSRLHVEVEGPVGASR